MIERNVRSVRFMLDQIDGMMDILGKIISPVMSVIQGKNINEKEQTKDDEDCGGIQFIFHLWQSNT